MLSIRWSSSFSFVSIRANRGSIQSSNHYGCLGTQSPDAVNKLLRLSNSNHQTKARAPQRLPQPSASSSASSMPTSSSVSPLISTSATSTGLSSLAEPSQHHRHHHHHHATKVRDTNKLTSESSSLNFKASNSSGYTQRIRSQTRKLVLALFSSFDLSFLSFAKNWTRIAMIHWRKEVEIQDAEVSIQQIPVCPIDDEWFSIAHSVSLLGVTEGSDKSSSTIRDGFSSTRLRNRPPLPQSTPASSGRTSLCHRDRDR